MRETVDAIFDKGPARALTGPIARGDVATVERQLAMVEDWDAGMGALYRGLGLDRGGARRERRQARCAARGGAARGADVQMT